jgi:GNAT superfamily N-acetyltransferase
MNLNLRRFDDDYPAMIELWNRQNPDRSRSVEETRHSDANLEGKLRRGRFVAETGGEVVGVGEYSQNLGSLHPQKFILEGYVSPEFQEKGIGKALYERVLAAIKPYDPTSLCTTVRENQVRALRFLSERGFAETKRDWVSVLQVEGANLKAFAEAEERVKAEGVEIRSFAALLESDPEAIQKLHALFSEIRVDVPRSEPPTPISLETFSENILTGPDYDPSAFFIALEGPEWVGMSCMFQVGETKELDHWFTGTRRPWRGRGIAQALKACTVRFARENGFATIRTDNDSRNAPMLAINDRLGFRRGPAQISMLKLLGEAADR